MRVGVLQMDSRELDREGNRNQVEAAARDAAEHGADVLALPELWCSGYDLAQVAAHGSWQEEFDFLRGLSQRYPLTILGGSLLESEHAPAGKFANCAVAYHNGEELSRYRKLHLFAPLGEDRYLISGKAVPAPFAVGDLSCGFSICYDLRFPEVYRGLAAAGAEWLLVPAQWPRPRIHHWRALLVARAIENQAFVLGVNRVGRFGEVEFGGNSLLVSPWGEVLLDAGTEPGLYYCEISRAAVDEARTKLPVAGDRRDDLYPTPECETPGP